MMNKQCRIIAILFFVAVLIAGIRCPGTTTVVTGTPSSQEITTRYFHLNNTSPVVWRVKDYTVANEALVQVYCHLFAESTAPITLIIEPEDEWNQSQVPVDIGQEINVTFTNGNLGLDSDVYSGFMISI